MIFGGMHGRRGMLIPAMKKRTTVMNRLVDSILQFPY
jgi:hypothetical protein